MSVPSKSWRERPPIQIALRRRADALYSIGVRQRAIGVLEARVAELDAEIAALGGTRRKGRKPSPRLPVRAHGEMQLTLFSLLRERHAVTSADLADAVLAHFKLNDPTKAQGYAMRQRASQCIQRCARKGLIRCVGGVGKGRQLKRYVRVRGKSMGEYVWKSSA